MVAGMLRRRERLVKFPDLSASTVGCYAAYRPPGGGLPKPGLFLIDLPE
jgi:hypothetical protein